MGMINTKAGWLCQSDYFIDEAGQCGVYNNKIFQKINDGAAICVKYTWNGRSYIVLVSPVEEYAAATCNGTATNIITISATINDVVWNGTYYDDGSIIDWSTNYPEIVGTVQLSSDNAETIFNTIITAAQIRKDEGIPVGDIVKDLVTVDFVKSLIISVLKENNIKIFNSIDNSVVKYDVQQTLSDNLKQQARENIGAAASADMPTIAQQEAWSAKQDALTFDNAPTENSTNPVTSGGVFEAIQSSGGGSSTDAVKYTEQTLTTAQKTQARTNIGAGTSDFSGSYGDLTNAPPLVKGNGTGGNIIGGTGVNQNSTKYTNSIAFGAFAGAITDHAIAFGNRAFAGTNRGGKHAVAIGNNVRAEKDYEWAIGKCNQSNTDTAFAYGDGTSDSNRHNLMELKTNGILLLNGNAVLVPEAVTGYDATKTQVLKNVNGTFTWVDET